MSRLEDIMMMARRYRDSHQGNQSPNLLLYAFRDGAEWADNNREYSNKDQKSSWISVEEDLPCNHQEMISSIWGIDLTDQVLVYTSRRNVYIDNMQRRGRVWFWVNTEETILYWTRIPKVK